MTERDARDDRLRAELRASDPATSLPPADPTRVARLLEEIMTDQLTDESRADGTRHRSRLTWMVAAAAVVLMAAGAAYGLGQRDDDPQLVAGGAPSAATDDPDAESVTALGVDDAAGTSRCMLPTAEVIGAQTLAFDGVVQSITGDVVTLVPTRFYAGDETDLVTVEAPSDDLRLLLSAVDFKEGQRYLVSATDERVTLCGFSAPYDDALAATYAEAFPG